jgi:hypothetical protein
MRIMTHAVLPLPQHPSYASALRGLGLRVAQADTVLGPVQVIQRFGLRHVLRGPVWQGTPDQRAKALRDSRLHLINAEYADPALRLAGFRQTHRAASVAELALDRPMLPSTMPKWRATCLRHQGALRLAAQDFCARRHDWLLQRDLAQQRAKGFRALPHALIAAYAAAAPGAARVYLASHKAETVAAMVFLRHGAAVTYHLGWSGDAGRALGAHHQLLALAAADFAQDGCIRLDLGLVDTHHAKGLARFKIGTGADIRPLGGTWLRWPFF